ncbi:MAG: putative secreted protein [Labilithrix sp.]|nr:putative secreted protein [Labilithrix sp.]
MKTRALLAALPVLAALVASPRASEASDHVDGLATGIDIAADITDLFTFTSPERPDKLVLIMNVHQLALGRSRFSNAVDYTVRIRPIDDAATLAPSTDARREQRITCSFTGGMLLVDPRQHATCKLQLAGGSESIAFDTRTPDFEAGGMAEQNGTRVFAGVRSDPWFLDLKKILSANGGKKISPEGGKNGLSGWNVLSIVVEVDKSKLAGPLLAITAQTVRK